MRARNGLTGGRGARRHGAGKRGDALSAARGRRLQFEALEGRHLLAVVAVFDDPAYVDTTSPAPHAESDNIQASLEALGHTVRTIPVDTLAALEQGLEGADVLLIPPLSEGTLEWERFPWTFDARAQLVREFVAGGKGLIVHGRRGDDFINSQLNGADHTIDTISGPFQRLASHSESFFSSAPAQLESAGPIDGLRVQSWMSVEPIYSGQDSSASAVATIPYGIGRIGYLGWNWDNAQPLGTQDGGWLAVLDAMVRYVGGRPEPVGPVAAGYWAGPSDALPIDLEAGQPGVVTLLDGADDAAAALALGGNTFRFYGTSYSGSSALYVSTNGLITFLAPDAGYGNVPLVGKPTPASIAVLWDDWRTNAGPLDKVLYRFDDLNADGSPEQLVIEWSSVVHVEDPANNPVTFQAILELNTGPRAGTIVLNYSDVATGSPQLLDGRSATIGIKDQGLQGERRLLLSHDRDSGWVRSGRAIRIGVLGDVTGTVWHDLDGDGARDPGEPGKANRVVYLDANRDGQFLAPVSTVADPDSFATGTDLRNAFPGITLSTVTTAPSSDRVLAGSYQTFASTGTRAFFSTWGIPAWFGERMDLRIDFQSPVQIVSIDAIGYERSIGRLQAFDANGNLLASDTTRPLLASQVETMTVASPQGNIAYAIASSDPSEFWPVFLDNLVYTAPHEPYVVTDAEGSYRFSGLAPGDYVVREALDWPWQPTSALHQTGPERLFAIRRNLDLIGATIYEFDPRNGSIINSFPAPPQMQNAEGGLAVGPDRLFLLERGPVNVGLFLWELDIDSGAVLDLDVLPYTSVVFDLAYFDGKVWLQRPTVGVIDVWDPVRDEFVASIPLPFKYALGLAIVPELGRYYAVTANGWPAADLATGQMLTRFVPVSGFPVGNDLAYVGGYFYTPRHVGDEALYRIDPFNGQPAEDLTFFQMPGPYWALGGDGGTSRPMHAVRVEIGSSRTGLDFGSRLAVPLAGPFVVAAGQSLALAAQFQDEDGEVDGLDYLWDLNGDGVFGDASGRTPLLSWSDLLALGITAQPATYQDVRVRAIDSLGVPHDSPPTTLTVTRPPVTVRLSWAPTTTLRGDDEWFYLWVEGAASPEEMFTYLFDWDGDGVFETSRIARAGNLEITHWFQSSGNQTIHIKVMDQYGIESPVLTHTVLVSSYKTYTATGSGGVNLDWGGTPGVDAVFFFNTVPGTVVIFTVLENSRVVNRTNVVTGVTGFVRVAGYEGDDVLVAELLTSNPIRISGGHGNDILVGGTQSDWLYGGDGNDLLVGGVRAADRNDSLEGGFGDDVLVGFAGSDRLAGDYGKNLLIADALAFADLPTALLSIHAEWSLSGHSFSERVENLGGSNPRSNRLNSNYFLVPGVTVIRDGDVDQLFGGQGQDWLVYDFSQDSASYSVVDDVRTNTGP